MLDSVNRAHAAQGLPPVHAVPVAVDQEQRVPVAEPIIRTAIAEGPTDDDGATTGEVPQPPPPPTPVNPAAIQVAPESVATLLTQEALQSQPLRHVSTGAATAEAPSEPQPQWLKPLTPLRTINPPQTAEPASVRPAEPPHPDDGPRVMHSFTDALTPAIDLSRPSRAIRRELHFAPWAEPLERMLEQRRVAMFVDGDRGCIKWLPRTATLAQALVYMRDSDVSGVPLYDGDQPVALLELADVAAFLCKAVRASPFEVRTSARARVRSCFLCDARSLCTAGRAGSPPAAAAVPRGAVCGRQARHRQGVVVDQREVVGGGDLARVCRARAVAHGRALADAGGAVGRD